VSKKASNSALDALHGVLAEHFSAMLKSPEGLKAADLNVIRQFLKDNGIDAQKSDRPDDPFNNLVTQALPFMDDEEPAVVEH
jgi:hypothetical protein